jgi:3-deoxy-D-manno-octulosonic-acid transferase
VIWRILYSFIVIPILWTAFHFLALLNSKVRKGFRGRRSVLSDIRSFRESKPDTAVLWVHASSMGEFEQAKPIIEAMKRDNPELCVVATFFSPSGLENNRRYIHADLVTYLPFDTKRNAAEFLDALQPTVAALIRYDVWPNYVWQCEEREIPVLLTNATMRANSPRLLPILRSFHHEVFDKLVAILTVSENDGEGFSKFGIDNNKLKAIGDTRYDRVLFKAASARQKSLLPDKAIEDKLVIVFGSSWQEDEDQFMQPLFKILEREQNILAIIVPHEPTIDHLEQLEYRFRNGIRHIRFSELKRYDNESVILVDSIGILLSLYASADIAIVGGGFKSNVHNTLEPAAYGIPVLFGPKIQNSQEASELADSGGAFIVNERREIYRQLLRLVDDNEFRISVGKKAGSFVETRGGATKRILTYLGPYFSKPS